MSGLGVVHMKKLTQRDPVLSRVYLWVQQGWPDRTREEDLKPYFNRRDELSTEGGCLLWGSRLVVPFAAQKDVIAMLHETHPGITRMKSLARSYVWWPGLDRNLEEKGRACRQCQAQHKRPTPAPLHPWVWPTRPWSRLHIDYAGPWEGKMFLVTVDAHSKWLDIHPMSAATSTSTIGKLREMFATHGLPETIVSDNGSVFTSTEFQQFVKKNGITHCTTAPYHPATNGLAERAVQTFKQAMKKQGTGPVETRLARFLFSYRITPHATTGESPAKLLVWRELRSHVSQLHPDLQQRVSSAQSRQKELHDKHA